MTNLGCRGFQRGCIHMHHTQATRSDAPSFLITQPTLHTRKTSTAMFMFPRPHPFCFLIPWHPLMDRHSITTKKKKWIMGMPKPNWAQLQCKCNLQCIRIARTVRKLNIYSSKFKFKAFSNRPTSVSSTSTYRQRQLHQQTGDITF